MLENLQSQKRYFLLGNLKIKEKTLMMFTKTCGRIQKRCMPEIIFSKKESQKRYFESFIFWSKFRFWEQLLGVLASVFFKKNFRRHSAMVADILTQPPTIKKLPTALTINCFRKKSCIIDVWLGSNYTSDIHILKNCSGSNIYVR